MSQAVHEIVTSFPGVTQDPTRLVVAVNYEYVDHSFVLHEGDEVALIPPVSGGCHDLSHK